jgi:SAM-dependent methyltransferase
MKFYDDRFQRGYMDEWPEAKRQRVRALIRQLPLPATGRALDFGCGVGAFTRVLHEALPGWEIEGTDLSGNAIEIASRNLPECNFHELRQCGAWECRYDLVFSHHVLEHVSDVGDTARLLARLAKPSSVMFHILPCGDPGSFEHSVCLATKDGIRTHGEPLFFFEEEGHLRRLDTDGLVRLWAADGFEIGRAWYDNHLVTSFDVRTRLGLDTVLQFADPGRAVNESARRKLWLLRAALLTLWALRRPVAVVRNKRRFGCHNARDYVLLVASLAAYPLARSVEFLLARLCSWEWTRRSSERGGSEMYICLVRATDG